MPGVGGDSEQRFGSGLKQDGVNLSRVLSRGGAPVLRPWRGLCDGRSRVGLEYGVPPVRRLTDRTRAAGVDW